MNTSSLLPAASHRDDVPRWHTFLHHVLAATVLASIIVLVELHTPWLHWLDSVALRFALPISADNTLTRPEKQPVVIAITDAVYERAFDQVSPLDRGRLSDLLTRVQAGRPQLVVIDLDLSPAVTDERNPDERRRLDNLLGELSASSHVVLPVPQRGVTVQEQQFQWVREMCRRGVHFGLPTLTASMNTVIRHDIGSPLLANVAIGLVRNDAAGATLAEEVCKVAEDTKAEDFFEAVLQQGRHADETVPLKTALLSPLNLHGQTIVPEWSRGSFNLPDMSGKAVFIGGAWAYSDGFFSALSDRPHPGVFMHAAAFSTQLDPPKATNHAWAYLVDIAVGTLLGYLFHGIWARVQAFRTRLYSIDKHPEQDANGHQSRASGRWQCVKECFSPVAKTYVWRGVLILGWTPPLLIVAVFFWISALLLNANLWLNPGPLVFGMFIDAIMAAKTRADAHADRHGQDPADTATSYLARILRAYPDLGWQVPLVVFTLWSLAHH